uniref:Uncharacterized protein n=1 Tax=Strongyloides stercoralis TaxID=6248 RepID=A0A0K0EMD3_STRER
MLLFLLTKSTLVFVTSLIIFLCLTAIITLLIIIILLTNDCWWHIDNYIDLSEQLNFPEKFSLKLQQDRSDLDQIILNEEINLEDEDCIDSLITKSKNDSSNNSIKSSVVHYDEKSGKTIHEVEKKINETNYSIFI